MGTTDSTDQETRTRILTFSHRVSGFVRPDTRIPHFVPVANCDEMLGPRNDFANRSQILRLRFQLCVDLDELQQIMPRHNADQLAVLDDGEAVEFRRE